MFVISKRQIITIFNQIISYSICSEHPLYMVICPWEIIWRSAAYWIHRNFTSDGFSVSRLRKYHYPLYLSSPPPRATRLLLYRFYRSLHKKVMAHLQSRLDEYSPIQVMCQMKCVFNFQGAVISEVLQIPHLLPPRKSFCTPWFYNFLNIHKLKRHYSVE